MDQTIAEIMEPMLLFAGKHKMVLLPFISLFLGWAGARFVSRSDFNVHLLDHPCERSSHDQVIPKGGGIGILSVFALAAFTLDISRFFIVSGLLISFVSFYDDIRRLSPRLRLLIHFLAAFILVGPSVLQMPSAGSAESSLFLAFWLVFSVLLIVATANFYNFMDGANGIAGITGIIAFGLVVVYHLIFLKADSLTDSAYAVLAACLALACLGFLPFNIPKARVFMGDVGSILLGFVFTGIILGLSRSFLDLISMASFLFLFYADAVTTIWFRLRERETLTVPHRKHLYQLLVNEFCLPHWKVSLGYGLAQLIIGLSVMLVRPFGPAVVVLLAVYVVIFALISFHIRRKLAVPA